MMLYRFGLRSVPPCPDCWEDGQCSMNCGPRVEETKMDTTDIAAAALKDSCRGPCSCKRGTRDGKPSRKCPKCQGTGTLTACKDCGGTGWNPLIQKMCQRCEGKGYRQNERENREAPL